MSPVTKETSRIKLENLFFSRTDERGVIAGANKIFASVSAYEMQTMLGAPHRLVRHMDMPRGVFHLMWDRLSRGLPVGAFVKNLAQDQTHYWVFAIVSPIEGGYLSVRLKPTSDLFHTVEAIYAELKEAETTQGRDPAAAAESMMAALRDLGFEDYDAFMSAAVIAETDARTKALGRAPVPGLGHLARLAELTSTIALQARQVDRIFRTTDQIPYNMRLQAARTEGADGPISVISENHRQMSFAVEGELHRFQSNASTGVENIVKAGFLTAASALMNEMAQQFSSEPDEAGIDAELECSLLSQLARGYQKSARDGLARVTSDVTKLGRQCREMRRVVAGLEMTRIMCKIERGRVTGNPEGLDEIVARLLSAEQKLSEALSRIEEAVGGALEVAETLTAKTSVAA